MANDKLDWTKETSQALIYFSKLGVPLERMDSIIEEVYEEIAALPRDADIVGLQQLVGNKFIPKVKQEMRENPDKRLSASHGSNLTTACFFYCFDRLFEEKEYSSFYDFLAQSKQQLKSNFSKPL